MKSSAAQHYYHLLFQDLFGTPTGSSYQSKVEGYSPVAYWPLDDAGGTTAAASVGTDGTYSAADIAAAGGSSPDGENSPAFVKLDNDLVDIYSAGLVSAFDGAKGTVAFWFKVAAGFWSDGAQAYFLVLGADINNNIYIYNNANNSLRTRYRAGGVSDAITATLSPTDATHIAVTWDKTADEHKLYIDGTQSGVTGTGLGVWAGGLAATDCVVGCLTNTGSNGVDGEITHVAVWDSVLSGTDISDLATV